MMSDYERGQEGNCKTVRVACGVRTKTFLGLRFFSRIFVLLNLSNVEGPLGGRGYGVSPNLFLGRVGEGTSTLTVDPHVLSKGLDEEHLDAQLSKVAASPGIFVKISRGKALEWVGEDRWGDQMNADRSVCVEGGRG